MAFRYRPHLSSGYVWFFSSTPCLSRRYRPKSSRGLLALTNRPTPFGSSYYLLRSCQLIGRTDDATRTNAIASFSPPKPGLEIAATPPTAAVFSLRPPPARPPAGPPLLRANPLARWPARPPSPSRRSVVRAAYLVCAFAGRRKSRRRYNALPLPHERSRCRECDFHSKDGGASRALSHPTPTPTTQR